MTRRRAPAERDSLILSAPTVTAAAEQTGLTRARASQIRTAAGIRTPTGRRTSPTSRDSLAALGRTVVADAEAVGLSPEAYLKAARAKLL